MFLSAAQSRSLSRLMVTLAEPHGEAEVREQIGLRLLDLLGADYYASYVWNAERGVFGSRVALNMSDRNLSSYEAYYQYHDPITSKMQQHREATLVEQVMPQAELVKTEFFNDFLHRDGLYWGVNLYAWDGDDNIGDMRIWRSKKRERFGADALALLELIKPAFVAALKRARGERLADSRPRRRQRGAAADARLSERERAVVQLASIGLRDKAIAQRLGIGFTTVRTHLGHAFRKLGVENRTQLADRVARVDSSSASARREHAGRAERAHHPHRPGHAMRRAAAQLLAAGGAARRVRSPLRSAHGDASGQGGAPARRRLRAVPGWRRPLRPDRPRIARIAAPTSPSAGTNRKACAVRSTAGSSRSTAAASRRRPSRSARSFASGFASAAIR